MKTKCFLTAEFRVKESLPSYQVEQNSSSRFGKRSVAGRVAEYPGDTNDSQFENIKGMQYADAYVNLTFSYEAD
jgi:hypothetical protein